MPLGPRSRRAPRRIDGVTKPRVLCISFSPLRRDSRVQRQIAVLAEFGDVVTVGYGPAPAGSADHLEIPASAPSLPQTPIGVLRLIIRAYRAVQLSSPGELAARRLLSETGTYDLVVANDARALPLAFAFADGAPVLADMHEWAPAENATNPVWRLLVKPYMEYLCRVLLPRASAVTTVSTSIAELYDAEYGVRPDIVRNAGRFRDLSPTVIEHDRIRLVHSGIAVPERNLEALIDAVASLDARFTLDCYLIGSDSYLADLRARATGNPRVTFHEPVEPDELPATLNRYDLGVFLLPPRTINNRLMLPNKFFDFVQARLGLVFGPAVETDELILEHDLGIVTAGWTAHDLVTALQEITAKDLAKYKAAADAAAHALSSESDIALQRGIIGRLLEART